MSLHTGGVTPARPPHGGTAGRSRYLTLAQVVEAYPVFSIRLLRRLVQQRRIAYSRAGRIIVVAEDDIEAYLAANRVEPARWEVASQS